MAGTLPILIVLGAALLGAAWLAFAFRRLGLNTALGGVVGAGAGAAGALVFMLPLNFCPFEAERTPADTGFGLLLVGLGMTALLWPAGWLARAWQERRSGTAAPVVSQPGVFKGRLLPWLLLAPTLIVLALFLYYPSLDTFRLSTLLARLGARRTAFVCVDNFTTLFTDRDYLNTLVNTLFISLAIVVIGLVLSLLIATLAYQQLKGARFYRTLLIWPYAISPVVAGLIFLLLFNPVGGIINYFLGGLGNLLTPLLMPITGNEVDLTVAWLQDPTAARWAIILASVWKSMGFNILFYIAGLQNVPNDLKEAASIDGANAVQRFWYVVIPLLSPITFFLVITNMTYAFFETFGTIDSLTGGGPVNATETLMYRIYEVGIVNNDLGKAAAQSIILFAMVIGLTVFQFRSSGRRVNYGA